jgi:hypothetical protein
MLMASQYPICVASERVMPRTVPLVLCASFHSISVARY